MIPATSQIREPAGRDIISGCSLLFRRISVCNNAGVSLPLSLRVPAGRTSSQHRLSDGVFICSGSCAGPGFYYPAPALTSREAVPAYFSGRQQATFPVLMAPVEEQVIVDSVFPGDLRHTGSGLQ
ncbi:hypothetical protein EC12741_B0242 [Escherichia coli 1.2741]|nr:hypothetical protein EC12741_B0242 [Escherichia coli 1.2741]